MKLLSVIFVPYLSSNFFTQLLLLLVKDFTFGLSLPSLIDFICFFLSLAVNDFGTYFGLIF